jgi:hypothetical protein
MAYFVRLACVTMAALTLCGPVFAQATKADEAHAAELKKQGDDLVHASKFREALQAYDDSFAIVPNPAIHYNRGRAFQSLEEFPAALDELEKFVATAPLELKARVPNLDKLMADIASHVATVVINCAVTGATVALGDKTIGTTPLPPFHAATGETAITVTAPGYAPYNQNAMLIAGSPATIDVNLKKLSDERPSLQVEEPPMETPPKPPAQTPSSGGSGWRTAAFVSGGVGIASFGAGMVFLGLAVADKGSADSHCPNKSCDQAGWQSITQAQTFATVSTVLVIVGGVALGVSVISFIVTPKSTPVQARLFLGPGSVGLGGSF